MVANQISARLRSCQGLVTHLRDILEESLALAKSQGYNQDWIDAINKALADNQEASTHIGNIATLIELAAPPMKTHEP